VSDESIIRRERHRVELVDRAAADVVEAVKERLHALNTRIEAGDITRSDARDEAERLEAQLSWLEGVIAAQKREVKLCERVIRDIEEEFPLDSDELDILLGGFGGGAATVHVEGWDGPTLRAAATLVSYDADADVAARRLDSVRWLLTRDIHEVLSTFGYRDVHDRESFARAFRFTHVDTKALLQHVFAARVCLGLSVPEQTWVRTAYEGSSWRGPALEFPATSVFVPALKRLAIAAGGADVRGLRGDVYILAGEQAVRVTNVQGDVNVTSRAATGGSFGHEAGRFTARRFLRHAHIHIAEVRGEVSVATDMGEVAVEAVEGDVRVSTVTGGATLQITEAALRSGRICALNTQCGRIEVLLPRGWEAPMFAETDYGAIHCDMSVKEKMPYWIGDDRALYAGTVNRHQLDDAQLRLRSMSGDIVLREAE
jgi:hypothetical protein